MPACLRRKVRYLGIFPFSTEKIYIYSRINFVLQQSYYLLRKYFGYGINRIRIRIQNANFGTGTGSGKWSNRIQIQPDQEPQATLLSALPGTWCLRETRRRALWTWAWIFGALVQRLLAGSPQMIDRFARSSATRRGSWREDHWK